MSAIPPDFSPRGGMLFRPTGFTDAETFISLSEVCAIFGLLYLITLFRLQGFGLLCSNCNEEL